MLSHIGFLLFGAFGSAFGFCLTNKNVGDVVKSVADSVMSFDRRQLLLGGLAVALAPNAMAKLLGAEKTAGGLMMSACSDLRRNHYAAVIHSSGELLAQVSLPERAHQAAFSPLSGRAVYIARRPGKHLYILDWRKQALVTRLAAEPNQHFFGHAVFSADGSKLYTTENIYTPGDLSSGEGVIVIRDAESLEVLGRFASGGIGPHQLQWAGSKQAPLLAVANGGILTHPDQPREKLNLDSMAPNLSLFTPQGELIATEVLENKSASIRHLDVGARGQIVFATQVQDRSESESLIYLRKPNQAGLKPIPMSQALLQKSDNYAASVCMHSKLERAVVTFPRGNSVAFIDTQAREIIRVVRRRDAAGVCQYDGNSFAVSQGNGAIHRYDVDGNYLGLVMKAKGLRWDNHLTAASYHRS